MVDKRLTQFQPQIFFNSTACVASKFSHPAISCYVYKEYNVNVCVVLLLCKGLFGIKRFVEEHRDFGNRSLILGLEGKKSMLYKLQTKRVLLK